MIPFVHDPQLKTPGSWRAWGGCHPLVTIRCPVCELTGSLDHKIAADGVVSPNVVCAGPNCPFDEAVRLDGWDPPQNVLGTPPAPQAPAP